MRKLRVVRAVLVVLLLPSWSKADQPTVLFDQGHGQRFLVERAGQLDLSGLAAVLEEGGLSVRTTTSPLTAELLVPVQALVISGPFQPLRSEEVAAVLGYLSNGGTLVTMLHIPGPLSGLLSRLGVAHSNGVVRETSNVLGGEPLNFTVSRLQSHPLTRGLSDFSIYGAWALLNESQSAQIIAASSPHSWVDLDSDQQLGPNDAVQSFGLTLVGKRGSGRFVVFGDDAMFQNRFLTGHNVDLARNLAVWLSPPNEVEQIALVTTENGLTGVR